MERYYTIFTKMEWANFFSDPLKMLREKVSLLLLVLCVAMVFFFLLFYIIFAQSSMFYTDSQAIMLCIYIVSDLSRSIYDNMGSGSFCIYKGFCYQNPKNVVCTMYIYRDMLQRKKNTKHTYTGFFQNNDDDDGMASIYRE